jgi:DNA-binding transcriptional LysR family regulator
METLSGMSVFVRVAEAKSLSVAARQLGVTPSAVSKTLAKLESRLGVQLLHRTTRQVSLTEDGRAFYERAKRILADVREAELALSHSKDVPRGRVRLSCATAVGRLFLLPRLPDFLKRQSEISIELTLRDQYVDPISDGVDVVVHWARLGDSPLIQRKLASWPTRVFAAPSYLAQAGTPRTPDALDTHQCLTSSHDGRPVEWRFRVEGREVTKAVSGRFSANSVETLRDMALAGLGLINVVDVLVAADVRRGALVPVLDPYVFEERSLFALYPPSQHLSPRVRVLVDWLVEAIPAKGP